MARLLTLLLTLLWAASAQAQFSSVRYGRINGPPPTVPLGAIESVLTNVTGWGNDSDSQQIQLGIKFSSSANGKINGVRFYKASTDTATSHAVYLWSNSGTQLATATSSGETASGWQEADFATPVTINANTMYEASYIVGSASGFHFADIGSYSWPHFNNNHLGGLVGLYSYGASPVPPSNFFSNGNYGVDVAFQAAGGDVAVTPVGNGITPPAVTNGAALTTSVVGSTGIGFSAFTSGGAGLTINTSSQLPSYATLIVKPQTYYGVYVNSPHILIQGYSYTDGLDITWNYPIVLLADSIRGTGFAQINARSGAPVYALYCDLGGTGAGSTQAGGEVIQSGNNGLNVFVRNYISYAGDGFNIGATQDQVLENYVELFNDSGGSGHNDGLQASGGNTGLVVARNKFLNQLAQTSAINLVNFGTVATAYVISDHNYIAGGGYTFYGGQDATHPDSYIVTTNNQWGTDFHSTGGFFGPVNVADLNTGNVWNNNTWGSGANSGKLIDNTGNTGAASTANPPTLPTNTVLNIISSTQINLTWTAPSGGAAVTSYQVYRNGIPVGTSSTPSYSDTGLTTGTAYTYFIRAQDAAGDWSGPSIFVSGVTP